MLSQRRDADRFGSVVASIEHIQPQLFRIEKGPVLPFAGHIGVQAGRGRLRNHRAPGSRHDTDALHVLWTERQYTRDSYENSCQRTDQVLVSSHAYSTNDTDRSVVMTT